MKKLIKNGFIHDGTCTSPFLSDILIEEEKIVEIKKDINVSNCEIIDASGKIVSPGFIDTHRHCDIAVLCDDNFGELELSQGLTTVIGGNCGLSPFPNSPSSRKELFDFIEPCLGIIPDDISATTISDYFALLENKKLRLNVGTLTATGAVRVAVKGYDKTPFTDMEMTKVTKYLDNALECGAMGISMGIMYNPECYTTTDEYVAMAQVAKKHDAMVSCHIRGEGNNLLSSVNEVIDIARKSGVSLNISHFKATGLKNWNDLIYKAIQKIENARNTGINITVDFYPYTGGSTTLLSLIPPSVLESDVHMTMAKLATKGGKEEFKKEIYKEHLGWDNMVTSIGWERIVISSVTKQINRRYCSKNIAEISLKLGYIDPSDFVCDLLHDEEGKVGIIVLSMSQEDVDTVAQLPYSSVISDSLYGVSDTPHPRLYASFPKIIRDYVKERKILTLSQAIQKMTSVPANRLGITNRGMLKVGNYADINIFDINNVNDNAVCENSKQLSTGMDYVLVNGAIALFKDTVQQSNYSGRVLKK